MRIAVTKSLVFSPSLRMALLTLVGVAILSALGYWQLCRAAEKRTILTNYALMQQQPPQQLTSLTQTVVAYQPLSVTGHYDNQHQVFLDNQFYQHQFGYDVITPLLLNNGQVLLIDRGWIASGADRQSLPSIAAVNEEQVLVGTAYFPSAKSWVFGGKVIDNPNTSSLRVERVDSKQLGLLLNKSIYPFVLRLNKDQDNGFIRDWKLVIMMPSRHIGYAVQWFLMALVVVIIFFSVNLERKS